MSANISTIFSTNPVSSFNAADLFYVGVSPYGATDDGACTYSTLIPVNTKGDLFTWSTAATKLAVGSNGSILTADSTQATGLKWTTATYPNTVTANQLLYGSASNTVSGLASGNNSTLVTNGTGVPSFSSTLPTAVQTNISSLGTIGTGTWQATTIDEMYGGTGFSNYTVGDLLYGSSTTIVTGKR